MAIYKNGRETKETEKFMNMKHEVKDKKKREIVTVLAIKYIQGQSRFISTRS